MTRDTRLTCLRSPAGRQSKGVIPPPLFSHAFRKVSDMRAAPVPGRQGLVTNWYVKNIFTEPSPLSFQERFTHTGLMSGGEMTMPRPS